MAELSKNPDYEVYEDQLVKLFMDDAGPQVAANQEREISIGNITLSGKGQSICIIDSGIDITHPDLQNAVVSQACFCSSSNLSHGGCCQGGYPTSLLASPDNYGHGTLIAGIITSVSMLS